MSNPRRPTKQELAELEVHLGNDIEHIDTYYFAVFDDYVSDCPAYAGKLMVAVWGMPEFYEVYIWVDGRIQKAPLDKGYFETC